MNTLFIDFETFSRCDIKTAGGYVYASHPTTEVLLLAWAMNNDPVQVADFTDNSLAEIDPFEAALAKADEYVAHNAQFDRRILSDVMGQETDLNKWRCTMCKGMLHGYPGSLEQMGGALNIPRPKLNIGRQLVRRFCMPAASNHKADRYDRRSHPKEWVQFTDYVRRDVVAMRQIDKKLPSWNWDQEEYVFDQTVNDRGFAVDVALVDAGADAAAQGKIRNAIEFEQIVKEYAGDPSYEPPTKTTQRARLAKFLNIEFDLEIENTKADTFREILKDDALHPAARKVMELSIQANKTSTAKYAALQPAVGGDQRHRGWAQFAGASRTRRWAGRTFQPHNLPSRGLPPNAKTQNYIQALKLGLERTLFTEDEQMGLGSAALRGVVVAPAGRKLVVSDLSNIEGRINAWLADEEWKLEAYRAYDRGEGEDLYKVTAGELLGISASEVNKAQRQKLGKTPELALGYAGGVGAIQRFAEGEMTDYWPTIQETMGIEYQKSAALNHTKWGRAMSPDVEETEWIASETVKLAWRAKHPGIVGLWKSCENAAKKAIRQPGRTVKAGKHLSYRVVAYAGVRYLTCRLPSGKRMVYCDPKISVEDDAISYLGLQSMAGEDGFGTWSRIYTYGGKLVENNCQSLARDILMAGMLHAEGHGYPVVLHVHDEAVCEMRPGEGAVDALSAMLAAPRDWLSGLPLAAAGFETKRYYKED